MMSRTTRIACLAILLVAFGQAHAQAGPKRVLHVAFTVEETGFDSQTAGAKYPLRMTVNFAHYALLSSLTTVQTAAGAREVMEAYADGAGWAMANPVGTGPYRLKEWRRGQRIVLEGNPGFREERYPDS